MQTRARANSVVGRRAPAQRLIRYLSIVGLATSCLLLGACAPTFPPVAPTPTPTTAALNGCPAQRPPARETTPDIVVKGGGGVNPELIDIRVGQTLEIQLSDSFRWSLGTNGPAQVLVEPAGNGWHDAAKSACVWQFAARAVGHETLSFAGTPICAIGVACPQFALLVQYTVGVSA